MSASSVVTTQRIAKRSVNRSNSCSPRRSKRVKTNPKVNQSLSEPESGPDAMGSMVSADSTTSQVNDRTNEETVVSNDDQNTGNSGESETQRQETNETSNVCIDLTEDDSVVIENNTESDSEIQCIIPDIEESELCILRDIKRRRNRFNRIPLRIEQTEQSAEVIEIQDSLQYQSLSIPPVPQTSSTPKKIIKCPVCLDEYSMVSNPFPSLFD